MTDQNDDLRLQALKALDRLIFDFEQREMSHARDNAIKAAQEAIGFGYGFMLGDKFVPIKDVLNWDDGDEK